MKRLILAAVTAALAVVPSTAQPAAANQARRPAQFCVFEATDWWRWPHLNVDGRYLDNPLCAWDSRWGPEYRLVRWWWVA